MPRSNVKYEVANQDADGTDYTVQPTYQEPTRHETYSQRVLWALTLISIYFLLSIGLTFYQQWLYVSYGFHYPLGTVLCHLVVKFLLAGVIRQLIGHCKGQQPARIPWKNVMWSLAPPGIASGLDIGLSNWAVSLITMSLYTMTKSTTIIFILGFALLFKLEKKSWWLFTIVTMISGGLCMFTYKSTQFQFLGFFLCLIASSLSGLRWTLAQMIMQRSKLGMKNPIDMIYYMQPWMLVSLLPLAIYFEGPKYLSNFQEIDWSNLEKESSATVVVLSGAVLAFSMEVMEFMVVTYTSSLTLSISGIFKEIILLVLAYEFKGDRMSGLNFIGLLLCLGGIMLHVAQKVVNERRKNEDNVELKSNSSKQATIGTHKPLIHKSSSLTDLLNGNLSSDEDDSKDSSSRIIFDIVQRREH